MKKNRKLCNTLAALLLILAVLIGCTALWPELNAKAAGDINVYVSYQADGEYVLPKQQVTASADLSEAYNYTDTVAPGVVSGLDVLIAAHKAYFYSEGIGGSFDTWLSTALVDYGDGYLATIFDKSASSSFAVNGAMPMDLGITYEGGSWGPESYGGLSVTQTLVIDGDYVEFFCYQGSTWEDCYTWFEYDGQRIESISVAKDTEIDLALKGYPFMSYGVTTDAGYRDGEWTVDWSYCEDLPIVILNPATGEVIDDIAAADEDGGFTVEFSDTGSYILSALSDYYWEQYIFAPWLEVNVTEDGNTQATRYVPGSIPAISTSAGALTSGTVGAAYNVTLSASHSPMVWSINTGSLPHGLTLGNNGKITGAPTTGGTYAFKVAAANSAGISTPIAFTITIDSDDPGTTDPTGPTNPGQVTANDKPSAVYSYLPAPGQFVNKDYQYGVYLNPNKTLVVDGSMVTLGAYSGSIAYEFDQPIVNDEKNPYGIDFIVFGNSTGAGSAEPAAVMVSANGIDWYELAGSRYYEAATSHDVAITYTNPDTGFAGAIDVPWSDTRGSAGAVKVNSSHTQAYYPQPSNYPNSKNSTFTASSVTMGGVGYSYFSQQYSPRYGYGDTHPSAYSSKGNEAANPYGQNDFAGGSYNGDGMDISWAVNDNGQPVHLAQIKYIKIYNPTMYYSSATGEISPEIAGVYRAWTSAAAVGQSSGLSGLSINGMDIAISSGVYAYSYDAAGASSLVVKPTSGSANILVNDAWVASGSSVNITAGDKLRIITQDGKKEPSIYTISISGGAQLSDNTELAALSVIPGNVQAIAGENNSYSATIDNAATGFRVRALPVNDKSMVSVNGEALLAANDWTANNTIALSAGQSATVSIKVTSASGQYTNTYTLTVKREASTVTPPGGTITVSISVIGDSRHGNPESHKAFQTWLAAKEYQVPAGSTVKYLTDMALINAGLPFTANSSGVYIASIRGLAELDNGPYSGWMYTINSKHPLLGYVEQTLKDGDHVEWHYSDDFTAEEGSEQWGGVVNTGVSNGAISRVVSITAQVSGGQAIATFADTAVTSALNELISALEKAEKAGTNAKGELVLQVEGNNISGGLTINLTVNVAKTVAQAGVALTITTPLGDFTLDSPALATVISGYSNSQQMSLYVEKLATGDLNEAQQLAVGNNPVYELNLAIGGTKISDFSKGKVTVLLPYTPASGQNTSNLAVFYLDADGSARKMEGSAYNKSKGGMVFTTSHFSLFFIAATPGSTTAWLNPFSDVSTANWFYAAVQYANEKGLINGVSATTFAPDMPMTRAMLVTVLYRCEGEPTVTVSANFSDVAEGQWYTQAISWASANGLIAGYGDGLFGTQDNITREQFASILYKYAAYKNLDTSASVELGVYADAAQISGWAQKALQWANANDIINGRTADTLAPGGQATRAEAATMLMRFMEDVANK